MYTKHAFSTMLRRLGEVEEADILDEECIEASRGVSNVLHLTLLGNLANRETKN